MSQNDIDAANAVAINEGDAGGHVNVMDAYNATCVVLGGAGGHLNEQDAINEIATTMGGASTLNILAGLHQILEQRGDLVVYENVRNALDALSLTSSGPDVEGLAAFDFVDFTAGSPDVLTDLSGSGREPDRFGNGTWETEGHKQIQAGGHDGFNNFAVALSLSGDFTMYLGALTLISASERFLLGMGSPYVGVPEQALRVYDGSTINQLASVFPTDKGGIGVVTREGTGYKLYDLDVEGLSWTGTTTTFGIQTFGALSTGYGTYDGYLCWFSFFNTAHAQSKITTEVAAIKALMEARGITF